MPSVRSQPTLQFFKTKLFVQLLTIVALAGVGYVLEIPIPVLGAAVLAVFMGAVAVMHRKHLRKKQMIGLVWFSLGAAVLCSLFVIREYVAPIRLTVLHIAALLLPPLFLLTGGKKSPQ